MRTLALGAYSQGSHIKQQVDTFWIHTFGMAALFNNDLVTEPELFKLLFSEGVLMLIAPLLPQKLMPSGEGKGEIALSPPQVQPLLVQVLLEGWVEAIQGGLIWQDAHCQDFIKELLLIEVAPGVLIEPIQSII
jgi:hypothetical protein